MTLRWFSREEDGSAGGGHQATDGLFFSRLDKVLGDVADQYDVVVIDCPPQLGYLTMSALCAATALPSPCILRCSMSCRCASFS